MAAGPQPNTSARLVDWRFLLPAPRGSAFEHLILLGGSSAVADTILELGVAHRVSTTASPGERADAVVILAGATGSHDDAVASLGPDGVLYWEVDRRGAGQRSLTPARATARLARSGLTTTAAYWVKPGFPERQMFLPIGATRAFRWYLNTLYQCTSPTRRVMKAGLRVLAASRRGLAALAPCYAITAVSGPARPASVHAACGVGSAQNGGVDAVFLAHGTAEWNRMAVLSFPPQAAAPTLAVKVARRRHYNAEVEWEHHALETIRAGLAPALRGSLPASSLFRLGDLALSVETCMPGAALTSRTRSSARQSRADLDVVADWLGEFHRATTTARVPAHAWLSEHLVSRLFAEYASTFGLTDAERRLFDTVAQRLAVPDAATLPLVWQHTDFGPWNVYRDGPDVSVIDWEVARRGPALVDLLYFVTHWRALVAGREAAPDAAAIAAEPAVADYLRRMQMSPALLPFLLVYMAVEQALDRARRFTILGRREAAGRDGNRYVGDVGALAENTDHLFLEDVCHAA